MAQKTPRLPGFIPQGLGRTKYRGVRKGVNPNTVIQAEDLTIIMLEDSTNLEVE